MSKLLLKILKSSIMPASLMVVAKVLGITIAVATYGFPLEIMHDNQIFSVQLLLQDYGQAFVTNSIASAFLLISMNVTALIVYAKQNLYLQTRGNPRTILKFTKLNILNWITRPDNGFVGVFIWTLFLLATNAITIVESLTGTIVPLLGVFAFVSTVMFIWGLVRTFEQETATIYPRGNASEF